MKCCICGKPFRGIGNNPDGAAWVVKDGKIVQPTLKEDDRCCKQCNEKFVIPGRLYKVRKSNEEVK